ncbi:4'-phosphopantetheinyl transferase superfamily protein [Thermomonospora cellulosilytica]|uniref:Acyl carrier protein/phosphopantetheinyl transferase n=1 Tax=Thermomonospora cellulosilytica TaxID=1411118 RepID=A0A7W3N3F4_9ACTN|nr:4'-phosphopantetheinyl transferase superfamily protein [Thermomonospora cellulosilytica]MBA9006784.1 acyl carrier protein/phosphopantetheinyl transferase [Thermomonospora cellulosilytica]
MAAASVRVLAVWTDRELPPHALSAAERTRVDAFGAGERRRRWLRARRAQRVVTGLLGLPGDVARRFPHPRLSLTHTGGGSVAAGVVGPVPPSLTGIGVDLEPPRLPDPRTARFFLDDRERAWLAGQPPPRRAAEHVRLWTLKEALFKADPANADATLRDYRVRDAAARHGTAGRPHRPGLTFGYVSGRLRGGHLSIALSFDGARTPVGRTTDMPARTIAFEQVADRIAGVLSVPAGELTPQTPLRSLTMDSFVLVEVIVDLQEEFDAVFSQAELKEIDTLGELVELLRSAR